MIEFSAALLCGGESRRMGRDKATMAWHGRPLWQWQLEKLRALGPSQIFISARTDPAWRPLDCEFVSDLPPSRGPLSGLAATLDRCLTSHLLLLAIDLPLLSTGEITATLEQVKIEAGCVPCLDGRFEPTAAIYPGIARDDVMSILEKPDHSLQNLVTHLLRIDRMQMRHVAPADFDYYRNLNSPNDLA